MKTIKLNKGKYAIVDDQDYERLNKHKWSAQKNYSTWYAIRCVRLSKGKWKTIQMHRVILGLKHTDTRLCDHKNHNGLDNRRDNLRVCTRSQNQHNRLSTKSSSSIYKGIYWVKITNKWRAEITCDGIRRRLGYYQSEIEAAKVYDNAAKTHHGKFALLNFPAKGVGNEGEL